MELNKWQQFLLHACIVCCGLALEALDPLAMMAICHPVIRNIVHPKTPIADNLTAQFGINLSLEPVLKQIEANATKYESWGDYPEDSHPQLG